MCFDVNSMSMISFPGLGIDEIKIDRVAFSLFGRDVMWYGLIITLGIVLAFFYVYYRTKNAGLVFDDLVDIAFFTVIPAIVCARLYYVIFYELENPGTYNDFISVIAIWNGGIAIYGAIIGGAIGAFSVLLFKKIKWLRFFDALAPSVMIGQILGRWGNFFNIEAYGSETSLPWRMGIYEGGRLIYVHPTFLYESLWNLLGFILINVFWKKRRHDGQVFLFYVTWYGLGRAFIEGLRTDSLMIGKSGIRVSQLIGIICFVIGLIFLILLGIKKEKFPVSSVIYKETSKHYERALAVAFPKESQDDISDTAAEQESDNNEDNNNTEEEQNGSDT